MAPSSSSTKKAARLAQKGKGKKVRFQGGTLFPLIVAIVMVLGLGTIVYARQSVPADDSSPPTVNDHWHAAYGFFLCDAWQPNLVGSREEGDTAGSRRYASTGVHSHDDGVIHWHPFTSNSVGKRAKLGVFLDVYEIELDNEALRFPDDQLGGEDYVEGETKCGTDDAELTVVVWESFLDTDGGTTYIANFDNIRITNDGMAFAIAFAPRDTDIQMPPHAAQLVELGAIDTDQLRPDDTVVTDGTVTDVTVTGDTTVTDGTVTDVTVTDVTVTGDTTATTAPAAAADTVATVTGTSTP